MVCTLLLIPFLLSRDVKDSRVSDRRLVSFIKAWHTSKRKKKKHQTESCMKTSGESKGDPKVEGSVASLDYIDNYIGSVPFPSLSWI